MMVSNLWRKDGYPGMFLVTDALKRVAKVVEGRGGEVLIPFHARTEKFTCIAI